MDVMLENRQNLFQAKRTKIATIGLKGRKVWLEILLHILRIRYDSSKLADHLLDPKGFNQHRKNIFILFSGNFFFYFTYKDFSFAALLVGNLGMLRGFHY